MINVGIFELVTWTFLVMLIGFIAGFAFATIEYGIIFKVDKGLSLAQYMRMSVSQKQLVNRNIIYMSAFISKLKKEKNEKVRSYNTRRLDKIVDKKIKINSDLSGYLLTYFIDFFEVTEYASKNSYDFLYNALVKDTNELRKLVKNAEAEN